ncbi:hypothetical protein SAMN05428945_6507 [Streptomyces sp. 2224.1]|nr:hypothetical protein [Streptomyces sp. 2224.1]SEE04814.1 hypothetical protein SAMN05428945_6507 [Streptomyces sp. 2224.1]
MNTTIAGAPTAAPHRRLERSDRIFVAGRRTPDAGGSRARRCGDG